MCHVLVGVVLDGLHMRHVIVALERPFVIVLKMVTLQLLLERLVVVVLVSSLHVPSPHPIVSVVAV